MARAFTGAVRDKTGTLASGRTVQVIRDVDNVCVSKTTTDALGEFTTLGVFTESGTVTTASASVITDSAKAWTVDEFAGHYGVLITSGTQEGEWRKIASNTATALTLESALPGATSVDDTFEVVALHTLVFNGEADRNALVYAGVMPTGEIWTPYEITTALWLDAASSDTITINGSNVSQWDDKSGNGAHAVQATAGEQPTHDAETGINLQTGKRMRTGTITWPTKLSLFVVAKRGSGMTGTHRLINVNVNNRFFMGLRDNLFNATYGTGSGFSGLAAATPNRNPTDYSIMGTVRTATGTGGATPRFNGEALNAVHGGAWTGDATIEISGIENLAEQMWVGWIKEIVLAPTDDLSTAQKIEGYLAWKWGLEANLPPGHPYKLGAP